MFTQAGQVSTALGLGKPRGNADIYRRAAASARISKIQPYFHSYVKTASYSLSKEHLREHGFRRVTPEERGVRDEGVLVSVNGLSEIFMLNCFLFPQGSALHTVSCLDLVWLYFETEAQRTPPRESEDASFDWFKRYEDVAGLFRDAIPDKNARILMLGCGNSTLSEDVGIGSTHLCFARR